MKGMTTEQTIAFNDGIIAEFRETGGKPGGRFEGNDVLLMTMTGARSGRQLTSPLTYHPYEDGYLVMASAGGDPKHPAWYFNLIANPDITLEVGTETIPATAVQLHGDDRHAALASMAAAMPRFGDYQAGVEREVPFFKLVPSS